MTFEEAWSKLRYGENPVGWMLRQNGSPHWLRLHSLPESKRYADTDNERAILITRQNELASEVLGTEPCWLVQTHWVALDGEMDAPDRPSEFRATREFNLRFSFAFVHDDGDESRPWHAYASRTNWRSGLFDDLLLDIADDRAGPTLWMGSDGAVFAPYDGGADIFLKDGTSVAALRTRHVDWLSKHPSGL